MLALLQLYNFVFLWMSYRCHHIACNLFRLAAFIQQEVSSKLCVHPRFLPFWCWGASRGVNVPQLVNPFTLKGHLESFRFGTIMNKAAIKIHVRVSCKLAKCTSYLQEIFFCNFPVIFLCRQSCCLHTETVFVSNLQAFCDPFMIQCSG